MDVNNDIPIGYAPYMPYTFKIFVEKLWIYSVYYQVICKKKQCWFYSGRLVSILKIYILPKTCSLVIDHDFLYKTCSHLKLIIFKLKFFEIIYTSYLIRKKGRRPTLAFQDTLLISISVGIGLLNDFFSLPISFANCNAVFKRQITIAVDRREVLGP